MLYPNLQFWNKFKPRQGAFSVAEAIALYNIVNSVPHGNALEAGTHKGKSASVIASALPPKSELFLVDPEFEDVEWANDTYNFVRKINPQVFVTLFSDSSLDVIPVCKDLSFVFIDSGSHCDDLAINEVKLLQDMIKSGGIIAFHDFGSQFFKPKEAAEYLISTGKYDWVHIDWQQIFDYVNANVTEQDNNSWHQYPELPHSPNFVGAVRRK